MDYLIRLELAALLAMVPASIAWVLGRHQGVVSARSHSADIVQSCRVFSEREQSAKPACNDAYVRDQAKPVGPSVEAQKLKDSAPAVSRAKVFGPLESESTELEKMREYARSIRLSERIWDDPSALAEMKAADPMAAELLGDFRQSISELRNRNTLHIRVLTTPQIRRTDRQRGFHYEIPRLTDAAPISLCADIHQIVEERRSRHS